MPACINAHLLFGLLVELHIVSFLFWTQNGLNLLVELLLNGCSICELQLRLDLWEQRLCIVVISAWQQTEPLQCLKQTLPWAWMPSGMQMACTMEAAL